MTGTAAQRWAAALGSWAIPQDILATSSRNPWGHPVARFAARADAEVEAPSGASFERAVAALQAGATSTGRPGSVLDVGAGAGAASLPLARWASAVTAVDPDPEMLTAFEERAARLVDRTGGPLAVRAVLGSWPDAAAQAGRGDVVVCHHVLFNVPDIGPFLAALTAAARWRVVVEVPPLHPMTWMNPLWERFHGLARPGSPSADDLVAVLHEQQVRALTVDRWVRAESQTLSADERATLVTRQLCLPVDSEAQVAAALADAPPQELRRVVTLTWKGSGRAGGRTGT